MSFTIPKIRTPTSKRFEIVTRIRQINTDNVLYLIPAEHKQPKYLVLGLKMFNPEIDNDLTGTIISAFYHVYNILGYGFLEKVFKNALKIELSKRGFRVHAQQQIKVLYDGEIVDEYFADLLVENIEIKTAEKIRPEPNVKRKLWTK